MGSTEQKKSAEKVNGNEVKVGIVEEPQHTAASSRVQSLFGKLPGAIKNHKKRPLIITSLLVLILGGSIAAVYLKNKNTVPPGGELTALNQALIDNDEDRALEYARKALAHLPDDMDTILAAANVIKKYEPEEAKQLYALALDIFKQENQPDQVGKSAVTYWAAATLAEDAGLKDEAKTYYVNTIASANQEDHYQQYLVNSAQTALARLEE